MYKAYPQADTLSQTLGRLFGRLATVNEDSVKLQVNDSIQTIVNRIVESDSIFSFSFKDIRFLGQITSPDSTVKIVSWNLNLKASPGKYFCYIIKRSETNSLNSVYRLTSDYNPADISEDTVYTGENWYGALYYDIRPFTTDGQTYWTALGINYGNPLITKKVIDIITFKHDGAIEFGAPVFSPSDSILVKRKVFRYSADAAMTLRFTDNNSIVFDHLVPFSPALAGKMEYYGPDFSYDAYILEKGKWTFKPDIDARNEEKPVSGR
jgi:hypothetical protein